jgi:CheY-like chemotaxis protein
MSSVLIIDDELDSADPLARFLRKAGHRVVCAPNGREALALLMSATPDAVILDLQMPEMDGASFMYVLRSYLRWDRLPVFIWTAYPESDAVIRAESLGASRVFPKAQVNFDQIKSAIDQCVGGC